MFSVDILVRYPRNECKDSGDSGVVKFLENARNANMEYYDSSNDEER